MIDPVMRDLDRHLADVDWQDQLDLVREDDPDAYAHLTDEELARELEQQAAEARAEESSW